MKFFDLTYHENISSDIKKLVIFFTECITATDCPDGGNNYACNANNCECPFPKLLDGDKCVGM